MSMEVEAFIFGKKMEQYCLKMGLYILSMIKSLRQVSLKFLL